MKFETPYSRNPTAPEQNNGPVIVETAGYVSAKKRIETIMLAGQRLKDWRENMFDFNSDQEIDWSVEVPTRRKGFDMAEASQLLMETANNLSAQEAAAELKKAQAEADEAILKDTLDSIEKGDLPKVID